MESAPSRSSTRRVIRLGLRLGVTMLANGAQATDTEASLRGVMRALGLPGAEAVVTYSTVTVSFVAPGDAEPTTAMQLVRDWQKDFSQLTAASSIASAIRSGELDLDGAEAALDGIADRPAPYPAALRFAAPGLSAASATILFGGSVADAAVTLAIGLAIQPLTMRVHRFRLPPFFETVIGVAATTLLVVLLVGLGLPIDGSLVLTGGLLAFLPGNALVSGMRDLLDQSIISGTAGLAEALLLAGAVAGGAASILAIGADRGIRLELSAEGAVDWAPLVIVAAGFGSVLFYAVRLGVPRAALLSGAALGALAVAIEGGLTPLGQDGATLLAALSIGVVGRLIARRFDAPATLWMVPAILPLLPGLLIVNAMLAATDAEQVALLGDALVSAFLIGVGVASGDIVVSSYLRIRERIVEPAVEVVSGSLAALVAPSPHRDPAVARRPTHEAGAPDDAGADGREGDA
jgi:uncharacterized membrane protein YjjP (DUF1212 family)